MECYAKTTENNKSQYAGYRKRLKLGSMLFRSETTLLQKRGYVLGADLGEGSYAKVKSAIWQRPGYDKPIRVALKIINGPDVPQDFKEKFLPRELDIVQVLNHPNVIKTMEIFSGGKKTYMTLEFAGRGDLLTYVQLCGPLKEQESAILFKQLVEGLVYLHTHGVVHRDLKCENILLNHKKVVKIADFGFARKMSKNDMSTTFCGSAAYASPEILQGIPYRGDVADNWSAGVILFVMTCAIMPYRDGNVNLLMMDQRLPLRYSPKLDKSLSAEVKALMQGILTYDIKQRLNLPKIQANPWLNIPTTVTDESSNNNPTSEITEEEKKKVPSISTKVEPSPQALAAMEELADLSKTNIAQTETSKQKSKVKT